MNTQCPHTLSRKVTIRWFELKELQRVQQKSELRTRSSGMVYGVVIGEEYNMQVIQSINIEILLKRVVEEKTIYFIYISPVEPGLWKTCIPRKKGSNSSRRDENQMGPAPSFRTALVTGRDWTRPLSFCQLKCAEMISYTTLPVTGAVVNGEVIIGWWAGRQRLSVLPEQIGSHSRRHRDRKSVV